jgi:hypothetical protein
MYPADMLQTSWEGRIRAVAADSSQARNPAGYVEDVMYGHLPGIPVDFVCRWYGMQQSMHIFWQTLALFTAWQDFTGIAYLVVSTVRVEDTLYQGCLHCTRQIPGCHK